MFESLRRGTNYAARARGRAADYRLHARVWLVCRLPLPCWLDFLIFCVFFVNRFHALFLKCNGMHLEIAHKYDTRTLNAIQLDPWNSWKVLHFLRTWSVLSRRRARLSAAAGPGAARRWRRSDADLGRGGSVGQNCRGLVLGCIESKFCK